MTNDFARYLAPREVVRWTGRPQQGLALRPRDIFLIPFSIVWCGFAIFWEVEVWRSGGPSFFLLFGAVFVCVGVYFVFGRFFWDAFLRARTQYALTDQRALILSGLGGNVLTEVDLQTTSQIQYKEIDGSRGTISFGPEMDPWRNGDFWHPSSKSSPEFFKTSNAAAAYRVIQAARSKRS